MNGSHDSLRTQLREADPGGGMRGHAAEVMRRRVVAEAKSASAGGVSWARWIPAVAGVLLLVFLVSDWIGAPRNVSASQVVPEVAGPQERQIQFSTPGGTRVIWVLDSEFKV